MWKKSKKSKNLQGCYNQTYTLAKSKNSSDTDDYVTLIYVEELERYNNGMSKVKYINVDIISGFSMDQYSHIRRLAKERFVSLKQTSDIEWLISEKSIKEERKEKLEKINNSNFITNLFK